MPLYTKANDRAILCTGIGTAYPDPYAFSPNGGLYGITPALWPFVGFNVYEGGPIGAFTWDAANWGAALTDDPGIIPQALTSIYCIPYGGAFAGAGQQLLGNMTPTDVTFTAVEFPIVLDDTQQTGVAFTYVDNFTYSEPVGSTANGFGGGFVVMNRTDPMATIGRQYTDISSDYFICGGLYDGALTPLNLAKFDGSLIYAPIGIFGVAAPYKMLATDFVGYPFAEAEFTPEPFGTNGTDGTFTNTELEMITFDDPYIQDLASGFIAPYFDAPMQDPANDIIYSGFETGADEITYIGFMPLTQTYDVLIVTGYQSIAQSLYDAGYTYVQARYDSALQTITLYGMAFVPPPEPITVPIFTAVRLPCIVNCVPLIDRRYSR